MTTTRKKSPFAAFLNQKAVQEQLIKNIGDMLTANDLNSGCGLSYVTRYFNHFPEYSRMKPLLNCLAEALTTGHFEIWLNLAVAYALDDLFDSNGNLHQDVAAAINYKSKPDAEGTWDLILRTFKRQEKIFAFLFCSYLQMYNNHGTKLVTALPDSGSTDLDKNPLCVFSRINTEFKHFEHLDKKFIDEYHSKLSLAINDTNFKFDKLKPYVECHVLMSELNKILDVKPEDATPPQKHAQVVLGIIKEKSDDPNSILAIENLVTILHVLKNLLVNPREANYIQACKIIAVEIDKLSPGEIIKGVAVGVGGAVVVTVSALVALATFGIVTIPALVFSEIVGGVATATSATSLFGTIYNDFTFFKRYFQKSTLATELENVANSANELLQKEQAQKKLN